MRVNLTVDPEEINEDAIRVKKAAKRLSDDTIEAIEEGAEDSPEKANSTRRRSGGGKAS